jgi:hypothetical protein
MRLPSIASMKQNAKDVSDRQPKEGTAIRLAYDALKANPGKLIQINWPEGLSYSTKASIISRLRDTYGFDIKYRKGGRNVQTKHMLAGEWNGKEYADYTIPKE